MVHDLVSIIIPVYNVENYLERCLDSVCKQSYEHIEILLFDDGSTDSSYDICCEWVQKDDRIHLYSDENRGVSAVRNAGLNLSSGEYITFVDSDDVISEQYIQTLLQAMKEYDADLSMISYVGFKEGAKPMYQEVKDTVLIDKDLECCFFEHSSGVICSKMYRKKIIVDNGICFDEAIAVNEDLLFNLRYVEYCRIVVYNASVLYGYLQRSDSASHNNVSNKWFTCLQVYKRLFESFQASKVYKYIVYYYLKNLYEGKYLLETQDCGVIPSIDIAGEIKKAEKKRSLLSCKQNLKLYVCKYFMSLVIKRRNRATK